MIKWLKKYFIPHERNDYKPHILRSKATIFILGIVVAAEILFLIQIFVIFPNASFFAEVIQSVLIQDTNVNRLAHNLTDLKINSLLTQAAQLKADDMAANGYFAHTSPKGITPWYWFQKVGYNYSFAGENLAINFSDSQDAVNAWMNSPSHRANILNANFTDIGIGITQGIYQNKQTIFIVQMFGKPAAVVVSAPIAEEPAATKSVAAKPAAEKSVAENQTQNVKAEINSNSNPIVAVVVSPNARTKYIYFIILAVILLALILNVFIKIKFQHPRLIMNAAVLIIIINSVLILNQYIININAQVF